jgi:chromosome segregation ATPase
LSDAADERSAVEGELRTEVGELDRAASELRTEVRSLRADNERLSGELASQESRRVSERTDAAVAVVGEHAAVCARLQQDLEDAQQKVESLTRECNDADLRVSRFRKALQGQRALCRRQEAEIAELRRTAGQAEDAQEKRHRTEKAEMAASFEETIAKLREECGRQRESAEQLTSDIAAKDAAIERLNEFCKRRTRQKQRLEAAVHALEDDIQRQKRLCEAQSHSRSLALDTEYREKIASLQAEFDAEKNRMFTLFAQSFSQYFNVARTIDEQALLRGLDRWKEDFSRLCTADGEIRGLLNAADGQTTQDAVAQLAFLQTNNNQAA